VTSAQDASPPARPNPPAPAAPRILILGGTAFLGPELVEAARARGWHVTLFNRGRTNPGRFADLPAIRGDRDPAKDGGLKALAEAIEGGARWDAVVDTSGYFPAHVKASAELLKRAARQYVFISTVSVYAEPLKPGADEDAPVGTIPDPTITRMSNEAYGPLKALCEREAAAVFGDRATSIRPGLIVGPGDPTDRFTYWPVRIARGGRVLVPGFARPREAFVSMVDVRDVAEFAVRCIADGHGGTFNCSGPAGPLTFDEMVAGCKAVVSTPVEFVPVDEAWLLEQRVAPWMGLPLWIPQDSDSAAMGSLSRARAIAAGCTFRPLADTARDTLRWWQARTPAPPEWGSDPRQPGLSAAREAGLLKAWAERA
jgi:2'-hydroxyisoflavone reductase